MPDVLGWRYGMTISRTQCMDSAGCPRTSSQGSLSRGLTFTKSPSSTRGHSMFQVCGSSMETEHEEN